MSKLQATLQHIAQELINLMEISAEIEVVDRGEYFEISLNTQDSGLLIGYHGDTLDSLRLIISQILYSRKGYRCD